MTKNEPQQQIWEREYSSVRGVITSTRSTPSTSVKEFLDYLHSHNVPLEGKAIDLGCGAGRNSIFLATKNFEVRSIDFSTTAISQLRAQVEKQDLSDKVEAVVGSIGQPMPFKNHEFDIAIDVTATNSLDNCELKTFASETRRILKPTGYLLSYVMAEDDEYLCVNPDKDGFTVIPESGLRDRAISKSLLSSTYSNWEIVELRKKYKEDLLYGRTYKRALWWMVARPQIISTTKV